MEASDAASALGCAVGSSCSGVVGKLACLTPSASDAAKGAGDGGGADSGIAGEGGGAASSDGASGEPSEVVAALEGALVAVAGC